MNLLFCTQKISYLYYRKVSISIDKQDVESILNILSKEAGLKYNINDRQITVTKVAAEAPQQEKKEIKVTGKVLDENGEGVPELMLW